MKYFNSNRILRDDSCLISRPKMLAFLASRLVKDGLIFVSLALQPGPSPLASDGLIVALRKEL